MNTKQNLSVLWLFAVLNYLYCDIVGLMDANILNQFLNGSVGSMEISQAFLLGASLLMEVPIAMVVLSLKLSFTYSRIVNIVAGALMTSVQIATLIGSPTNYYVLFSAIEIFTTAYIVWKA